ncbi:tyrosine-type recombinase/integrase [Streptococcus infantarius]|uniref:tyrosine-type recombinase/integrase n=1 Tax=Streptococcus infantarius TaxID=102684 RepID=UPI0022E32EFC|nr:tyrosine-type recombinase/integrase [Streptococcus infantarius]
MNELQRIQRQNNSLNVVRTLDFNTFERFINYLDASPKTVETYKKALRQFFNYIGVHGIRQPQREDVLAFRDDLKASGLKPTTVQNYITATRIFFKWTEQEGLYPNIAEHVKGAKLDKNHKKDYLTSRQAKEVLAGVQTDSEEGLRNYAILSLMVTGGLRTIEVSRANVGDLRTVGENTVLFVQGKGREEKTEYIKISAPVEKAIRTYLKVRDFTTEEQPLFTSTSNNSRGKRITTRTVSAIVKNALKNAGYDSARLTAHSLRHTAITLALLAGREITEVQQFARHANLNTTMIYNHALDQAKNGCSDAITNAIF